MKNNTKNSDFEKKYEETIKQNSNQTLESEIKKVVKEAFKPLNESLGSLNESLKSINDKLDNLTIDELGWQIDYTNAEKKEIEDSLKDNKTRYLAYNMLGITDEMRKDEKKVKKHIHNSIEGRIIAIGYVNFARWLKGKFKSLALWFTVLEWVGHEYNVEWLKKIGINVDKNIPETIENKWKSRKNI
jgi:hypothetical protein